tara:strand:+ start:478 stop:858 length:381 start_codon:yes stop_codon:yes gene_type:complete
MYKDYEVKLNAILDRQKGVQKTNLGVVDDLKKLNTKSETTIKNSKKLQVKIDKSRKTYNDLYEKTRSLTTQLEEQIKRNLSKIKEAAKAAKQLGVKVTDINEVAKLEETNTKLQREINLLRYPAIR